MVTPIFDVNLRTSGLQEAIRAAQAVNPEFTGAVINDGLRQIGRTIVPTKGTGPLANETPRRTGKLARSTFFEVLRLGFQQILLVKQPAKTPSEYGAEFYGGFVRTGTKKHEIRPRLKKVLRFEIGQEEVFAARVSHPGTKPNRYHIRTLRRLTPAINAVVARMVNRLTERFQRVRGA